MKKKSFIVGMVMFGISVVAFVFAMTFLFEIHVLANVNTTEALGLIILLPFFLIALVFTAVPIIVAIILLSGSTKSDVKALRILSIIFLVLSICILIADVIGGLSLLVLK